MYNLDVLNMMSSGWLCIEVCVLHCIMDFRSSSDPLPSRHELIEARHYTQGCFLLARNSK
jgi:hypothetical protein